MERHHAQWGIGISAATGLIGLLAGSITFMALGFSVFACLSFIYFNGLTKDETREDFRRIAFWVCLIIGLGFVYYANAKSWETPLFIGLPFLVVAIFLKVSPWFKKKVEPQRVYDEHGSADWAISAQLVDECGLSYGQGLFIGGGLFWNKPGHLLTIAASGKGKGTCLIIPTLLLEPERSFFVTDPKGENAVITAGFQSKIPNRKVHIIDPWNEQGSLGATHGIKSSGFDPMAFIQREPEELRDNCELIASYLLPENPNLKDPYWNERAKSLIKTLLMHIITSDSIEDKSMWTLYKMLRFNTENWAGLIIDMTRNMAEDGLISFSAQELMGIADAGNTLLSIRSSAQNATTFLESPQIRKSLSSDDFNPYDLTDGNTTVYLDIPERYMETHAVWMRMVVGLTMKACNAKPRKKITFMLDELPILGKMSDVLRGYSFGRGQNISIWSFAQSLAQLEDIYGKNGMNSMVTNSVVFHAFGVSDEFTTNYVSNMLGVGTRMTSSESFGNSDSGSSSGRSYSTLKRQLMTPDEVASCDGVITFVNGKKKVLEKMPYYLDQHFEFGLKAAKRPQHQY